jgi:hypothetical protein
MKEREKLLKEQWGADGKGRGKEENGEGGGFRGNGQNLWKSVRGKSVGGGEIRREV